MAPKTRLYPRRQKLLKPTAFNCPGMSANAATLHSQGAANRLLQRYTAQMHLKAASKTLLLAVAAGTFCLSALAQWQWVDKDGRKVFSDRPPPAEILDKNILKRPGGSARAAPEAAPAETAAAPASAAKASAPKITGKDPQLEAKKKQAEDEEAVRKKAEEEKTAKTKVENCARAKQSLATLQSGIRVATVNAKGEREIFDDAKRAAETKRTQESIASSCN